MPTSGPVSNAPRVLYLPNEGDFGEEHWQVGGRAAFAEMLASGDVRELEIYSFLADYRQDRDTFRSHANLVEVVRAFQPDILFWQHPQDFPIDIELIRAVRGAAPQALLAYHEADPFDRYYKPLGSAQKVLYAQSDVFFSVALGLMRELWENVKVHPHFYHSPSAVDRERFAAPPDPARIASKYDAVMFGSIAARFKFLIKQPGSGQRVRLARRLAQVFGERFACFGNGWPAGTNHQGTWPYARQTEVIQQSRMSVIWELYPEHTFYFSDRLPIALAAGVPFITTRHIGYDRIFANTPGLFLASSIEEIVDTALYIRSLPLEELIAMGAAGRAWMLENLEARVVFRRAFEICRKVWLERAVTTA